MIVRFFTVYKEESLYIKEIEDVLIDLFVAVPVDGLYIILQSGSGGNLYGLFSNLQHRVVPLLRRRK